MRRLELDARGDWLRRVRRCPSPNHDRRPAGTLIDLVIIHGISLPAGEFGGPHIEALFTNCLDPLAHPSFPAVARLRVSAHVLIRRDASIVQFVAFTRRAWHAGPSSFDGRPRCNDFSIGVELEGCDWLPYAPAQYRALAHLVSVIRAAWPRVTARRIVGHSDVAPARKSDPGPVFDWRRIGVDRPARGPADAGGAPIGRERGPK